MKHHYGKILNSLSVQERDRSYNEDDIRDDTGMMDVLVFKSDVTVVKRVIGFITSPLSNLLIMIS